MSNETEYVKCEDCGRRLPGTPRKCDVCGGRMTSRAENSYYTPEGIITKSKHNSQKGKTPDREASPIKRSDKNTSYSSSEKKSSFVDRLGDAVDVFADSEVFEAQNLKKIGQILTGTSSQGSSSYSNNNSSESNQNNKRDSGEKTKSILKAASWIVIIAVGIIFVFNPFSGSIDDYDDSYESYDDYKTQAIDSEIITDYYTLSMLDIEYEDEDEFLDELNINFEVTVTGKENLDVNPLRDLDLYADGEDVGNMEYVSIYNETTETDTDYFIDESEDNSFLLETGDSYSITLKYYNVHVLSDLELKHNLSHKFAPEEEPPAVFMNIDI